MMLALALLLVQCLRCGAFILPHYSRGRCGSFAPRMVLTSPPQSPTAPPTPPPKNGTEMEEASMLPISSSLNKPVDKQEIFFKGQIDLDDVWAFWDRTLDTFDDAALHAWRLFRPTDPTSTLTTKPSTGKPRVLVVGTGWGGHALSKVIDIDKFEIVYVSRLSYFLFTPMLCAASVGTIDIRSITESIKLANPHVAFVHGTVGKVSPEEKKLVVSVPSSRQGDTPQDIELYYDTLVYAAGAKAGTFGVKGVEENCYMLKEASEAQRLRSAIITRFDEASLPNLTEEERRTLLAFVVIGSGPTGIEFTGELYDLIKNDIPRVYPDLTEFVTLKVVTATDTILPMFDKVLQQKGLETFKEDGIDVLLGRRVQRVQRNEVILDGEESLPFGLCFWAGGTAPRELTLDLIKAIPGQNELEGAARGLLTTDEFLRVQGANGTIIAIGDATKIAGGKLPQTGQVAAQQGAYVARLLNRGYNLSSEVPEMPSLKDGGDPFEWFADIVRLRGKLKAPKFHFLNLGVLAYVGDGQALASLKGGDNTKLLDAAGRSGYLLWRSTYWVKQVSFRNRLSVTFDWIKSRMFGRDITKL